MVTAYNRDVDSSTCSRLVELNHQFYQTFAQSFSATRQYLQPGVKRLMARIPCEARLLDLGCGNGELCRALASAGFRGSYTGLDFSAELLQLAESACDMDADKLPGLPTARRGFVAVKRAAFLQADLSTAHWDENLAEGAYDIILAFAVFHHLPTQELRLQTLCKAHRLLVPGGKLFHSEWQFLNSPRLRSRIQPWQTIGLTDSQLDPGDYLLDWRQGGYGLRYVHHFDQDELSLLAERSGFRIMDSFLSDGEGGRLGLYQTWSSQSLSPLP
jgi:2-polyprenyl-3-methyl-5-hydroxy-6-metoxy-1,4-benzoquinol methylase